MTRFTDSIKVIAIRLAKKMPTSYVAEFISDAYWCSYLEVINYLNSL